MRGPRRPIVATLSSFTGGRASHSRQTVYDGCGNSVTLACGGFESFAVHDRDLAPTIRDETGPLECGGDLADRGAGHSQHHRDKFLREGKGVGAEMILRGQQPTSETFFNRVDRVACS